jgi:hypothetical protein
MTRILIALIVSGLLVGCATVDVRTDWDPAVDFSGFETFALMEDDGPSMGQLIERRIQAAVVEELESKGLRRLETTENADLAIGLQVATQNRRSYRTVSTGWSAHGYRRGRHGPHSRTMSSTTSTRTTSREFTVGALVIAIFDGESKNLAWQGSGSRRLDSSGGPERSEQRIRDAVQRILREFPPGA